MKLKQHGFTILEVLLFVLLTGSIVAVFFYVRNQQSNKDQPSASHGTETTEENKAGHQQTSNGIYYTVPAGWVSSHSPFEPKDMEWSGNFLLSPDYEVADFGQLIITNGANISFDDAKWQGITSSSNIMHAKSIVERTEGAYIDYSTVEAITLNDKELIRFGSGHTTDGVTYLYRTANGKWIEVSFNVPGSAAPGYEYKSHPHYQTFRDFLEEFVAIN